MIQFRYKFNDYHVENDFNTNVAFKTANTRFKIVRNIRHVTRICDIL